MDLTTIANVQRLLGETEALDADFQAQLEAKITEVSARAAPAAPCRSRRVGAGGIS